MKESECPYKYKMIPKSNFHLFALHDHRGRSKDTVFIRVPSKVTAEQSGIKLYFRSIELV